MCLLVLAQILRRSCEPVSSRWKFDAYELAWYQILGFHFVTTAYLESVISYGSVTWERTSQKSTL